jgi:hypothetical protein
MTRIAPAVILVLILLGAAGLRADRAEPEGDFELWGNPFGVGPAPEEPLGWLEAEPRLPDGEALHRLGLAAVPVWEPGEEFTHDVARQISGPLGSWTCRTQVADRRARRDNPLAGGWRTDDSWNLDVTGPLFVFGSLAAGCNGLGGAEVNVTGKTGLGCKMAAPLGGEVTVRGGPLLTYTDPLRSEPVQEKSEVFVELQARYPLPLPGKMGLEYQGAAVPALGPLGNRRVNQEVRLAIPVGDAGLLKVGAKHQWDDAAAAAVRSWRDGMQVFLGLEVKPPASRK